MYKKALVYATSITKNYYVVTLVIDYKLYHLRTYRAKYEYAVRNFWKEISVRVVYKRKRVKEVHIVL